VTVTQYMLARTGQPPHWCGLSIDCPHGVQDGEAVMVVNAPSDVTGPLVMREIHRLTHAVISEHAKRAGCDCARSVLTVTCWMKALLFDVELVSGRSGGSLKP
jgi:hypothetical protein